MVMVDTDTTYYNEQNAPHPGYFIHEVWKENLERYAKRRIAHKLDNIFAVSGLEGSGKTTLASLSAKYLDPTFPGPLLNDGTPRRRCDRMVFTIKQIMNAIDTAKPGQSIQIDEAIITLGSQDAANEFQKLLVKKFTTIRKKRLNIFLLIPNFFMLRKPIAVFRTFALVHTHLLQGYKRGSFSVFSYDTKQTLYFRGLKDHNMRAMRPDFHGNFTNTHGYFYDVNEYDKKKDDAISLLSELDEGKGSAAKEELRKVKEQRNKLLFVTYAQFREKFKEVNKGVYTSSKFVDDVKRMYNIEFTPAGMSRNLKNGREQFGLSKSLDKQYDK